MGLFVKTGAANEYNEHWLAYELEANNLMKGIEGDRKPFGGYTIKHVLVTAAATVAEGQFNRFYMLGLCKRARYEGIPELEIYRAKQRSESISESQFLIGTMLAIDKIEFQLKKNENSFTSKLVKPNS
ncbi:MAG: hypothetical protein JRJ44_06435 [Deltaproteobacteria bacterium]|nr:hypothetical protein [Deltaproteobacteria bacterium]